MKIKIPITATGEFDLPKQKEIAKKYRKIEEIKNNVKRELEKIEKLILVYNFNLYSNDLKNWNEKQGVSKLKKCNELCEHTNYSCKYL